MFNLSVLYIGNWLFYMYELKYTTAVLYPIHKCIQEVTKYDHIKLISQMKWNREIYYILTVYNNIIYCITGVKPGILLNFNHIGRFSCGCGDLDVQENNLI